MRGGGTFIRRDKLEIINTILGVCIDGANKTKIVYRANLNFKSASSYIDMLVKNDLIFAEGDESSTTYKTTDKGLKLKRDFEEVQNMLKE